MRNGNYGHRSPRHHRPWNEGTKAPMSAKRGWIGDPQPDKEWHTAGWLREKGTGHSHFHSRGQSAKPPEDEPWPGLEVTKNSVDDREAVDGWR